MKLLGQQAAQEAEMYRALIAALALSVFTACTESDLNNRPVDSGGLADTATSEDDSNDVDTADAEPSWYRVSAQLVLSEGALQAGTLNLEVYGAVVDDGALCEVTAPLEGIEARESTPDPIVFHWWRLTAGDPAEEPCAAGLPETLMLGLGGLHPELEPGVDRDGYGEVRSSLYGAYLNVQTVRDNEDIDETAFLLGYAGTDEAYAGDTLAVDAGPLPDGSYRVRGIFLQGL